MRDWYSSISSNGSKVLERLMAALKPGGWLVAEEFDSDSLPPDPVASDGEVLLKTYLAVARLMTDRGFDRRFGRRLFARMRANGFTSVGRRRVWKCCAANRPACR